MRIEYFHAAGLLQVSASQSIKADCGKVNGFFSFGGLNQMQLHRDCLEVYYATSKIHHRYTKHTNTKQLKPIFLRN